MRTLEVSFTATLLVCSGDFSAGTGLDICFLTRTLPNVKSYQLARKWRWYRREDPFTSGFDSSPRRRKLQSIHGSKVATAADKEACDAADLDGLTRAELQALCKRLQLRAVGKTCELVSRLREHHKEQLQQYDDRHNKLSEEGSKHTHRTKDALFPSSEVLALEETSGVEHHDLESSFALDTSACAAQQLIASSVVCADRYRELFPEVSDEQWATVERLGELLAEWNEKMNLISRKDIKNIMPHHLVPCLAMAKAIKLEGGVNVLDVGTGGGLPGLPMAIYYPDVAFTLIDGTGKKVQAVRDMAERLGLTNVRAFHVRAEDVHESFDFIVGRAVTSLPKFVGFVDKNLKRNLPRNSVTGDADNVARVGEKSPPLKRGILYMRGEVGQEELDELGAQPSTVLSLQHVLDESGEAMTNGIAEGASDRGNSSIFHFTSETIWNRVPGAAGAINNINSRD